jgi:NADH:ubiquinone oxidoreductase subunit 3 (subunit A)
MQPRTFLLGEVVIFIAILLVGYVFAWRKGALDWE